MCFTVINITFPLLTLDVDLREFRRVLQDLTQQIDELERVKVDYSRYVFETERRNHQFILNKVSGLVRAQVDIYERISSKGLVEPTLEQASMDGPMNLLRD